MATLARDDNMLLLFEIDASLLVLLQLYSACDSRYRHTLTALPQVTVRVAQRAKFLTQRHSEEIITKEPFSSKRMSSKSVDVLFSSTTNFQWSGGGKSFDQDDDDEIEEEIIDDIEENCESDDIEEDCESDSEEEKSDHLYKFEKEKSEFENKAEKSKESEKSGDFWDAPRKEAGDSSAHDHFEEEFKEESEGAAGFQEDPVSVDNSEMGYEYDFEEYDGPEKSKKTQTCLKQLEEDKLALQKELEIEKEAKSQQDEAFKKLQEENDRLEKAVKKEREELKRMKTKVADLKKSQKEYRSSTEDLKTRISQMMANSDEDKKTIKKLHLRRCSLKHGNENAEAADIKALEDRLTEQQKQNLEKNNEIQFLRLKVQKLQDDIEAKDTTILRLQENVNKWASDVQKEQEKNSGNQDLSSENQTLRDEVEFLKNERELMQNDLDEEKAARRELEEPVKEDKSRFSKEYKKLEKKVTALPPLPPRCR
ncbi:transcriptional regulator ATRX homolog, partial [Simochromis diagramma]|uniref:transcriptional regulator ATRX homolog n=1 Tax=Simochromis diagramma TaxID=43689 RepID=UPI001A7E9971